MARRRAARLTRYRAKNGEWGWRIRAANGRIIAVAGETYKRLAGVDRGVRALIHALLTLELH
jgi:uncharacterized protein YegP (UPF0339 family)